MVAPDNTRAHEARARHEGQAWKPPDARRGLRLPLVAFLLALTLLTLLVGACTPGDEPTTTEGTAGTTTSVDDAGTGDGTGDGSGTSTTASTSSGSGTGVQTETRRLAPAEGPFSSCADCHAFLDFPGQVPDTLMQNFSHVNHLERGAACESCHEPPVHTEEGIRTPTMASCFTCHGQAEDAQAPGECEYCHPPDFPVIPPSHTPAFFQGGHPQVVELQGPDDCLICHEGTEESFCRDCHGLDLPHPEGWVLTDAGDPGDHVDGAYEQGESCARCHDNRVEPPGNCYGGECHGS